MSQVIASQMPEEQKPYAFVERSRRYTHNIHRIARRVSEYFGVPITHSGTFDASKEQVVILNLSLKEHQEFLEEVLVEEKVKHIKCLFIYQIEKDFNINKVEQFFKVEEIDLSDEKLPEDIKALIEEDNAWKLEMKISDELQKKKKRQVKEQVMKLITGTKPKKEMTRARMYLIKLKIEKYGTPDELCMYCSHFHDN